MTFSFNTNSKATEENDWPYYMMHAKSADAVYSDHLSAYLFAYR